MYTYTCGVRTCSCARCALVSYETAQETTKNAVLQCVALGCSVMQCVAACCNLSVFISLGVETWFCHFRHQEISRTISLYQVPGWGSLLGIMRHVIRWEYICKHMCTLMVVSQTHWTHTATITEARTAIRNVQLLESREIRERIVMSYTATHMLQHTLQLTLHTPHFKKRDINQLNPTWIF